MTAVRYLMVAEQGGDFAKTLLWQNASGVALDLTSYTGAMQVRRVIDNVLVCNVTVTITALLGKIELTIEDAVLADLEAGMHKYDLVLTVGSTVRPLLYGGFFIRERVTQ